MHVRTRSSANALVRATRPFVCAFAYAYLRLAARACLPRFAYVEHGTAIVYCCPFYYPRVMVARADLAWPIEIALPSNSIILTLKPHLGSMRFQQKFERTFK